MDLPPILANDPQVTRLIDLISHGHTDLVSALAIVCFAIGEASGTNFACDRLTALTQTGAEGVKHD